VSLNSFAINLTSFPLFVNDIHFILWVSEFCWAFRFRLFLEGEACSLNVVLSALMKYVLIVLIFVHFSIVVMG
jgi:hypothetical protein